MDVPYGLQITFIVESVAAARPASTYLNSAHHLFDLYDLAAEAVDIFCVGPAIAASPLFDSTSSVSYHFNSISQEEYMSWIKRP